MNKILTIQDSFMRPLFAVTMQPNGGDTRTDCGVDYMWHCMASGHGKKGELFTEGSTDVHLFILGDVAEEQACLLEATRDTVERDKSRGNSIEVLRALDGTTWLVVGTGMIFCLESPRSLFSFPYSSVMTNTMQCNAM